MVAPSWVAAAPEGRHMSVSEELAERGPDVVSRRDALRRGALAGGAVLWATPIIQVVEIARASAQTTSGSQPRSMRPKGRALPKGRTPPNGPEDGKGNFGKGR